VERFGKYGADLARRARGIDDSPIVIEHEAKSISQETTFARDIQEADDLQQTLRSLAEGVGQQLRRSNLCARTVKLKLRWPDFKTLTRQTSLAQNTDNDSEIFSAALQLFHTVWKPGKPVRLLGVGASGLGPPVRQLSLWEKDSEKDRRLQQTLDSLREKYGEKVVHKGTR